MESIEDQIINKLNTLLNSNVVIADNVKVDRDIFKVTINLILQLKAKNELLIELMSNLSEEEKAIETLKEVASDDFDTLGDEISPKMAQNILNVISSQRKEIEEKSTIIMAGAEKVKQLEKGNRSLMESRIKWKNRYYKEKEKNKENQVLIDDIKEHRIVYIDTPEFEEKFISKDKIREKIKELEITRNSSVTDNGFAIMSVVISNFKELLEENTNE